MQYKTKDKTTIHLRLSHFLYNGLDVTSAKLDMSMSEVVRMAIYEWLKNNYTKKELDWFSDRDDMVEALIDGYREKGRAGPIGIGGDIDELEEGVRKGELERVEDDEREPTKEDYDNIIGQYQKILDDEKTDPQQKEDAKKHIEIYRRIKERKIKHNKKKKHAEYDEDYEGIDLLDGKKRDPVHIQMIAELIERYPSLHKMIKNAKPGDLEAAYRCRKTDIETVRVCLEGAAPV